MRAWFSATAQGVSRWAGRAPAFLLAVASIVVWAATGPLFGFSDTWELIINTGTTIITFLMVFLIQNTQNRDTVAIKLMLDELVRAIPAARNAMLDLDRLDEAALERLKERFAELALANPPKDQGRHRHRGEDDDQEVEPARDQAAP